MKDKCLQFAEINADFWSETLLLATETTVIATFLQKWMEDMTVRVCARACLMQAWYFLCH